MGIEPLAPEAIREILDLSDSYVDLNRRPNKHSDVLAGRTQVNMFFENSTRTQASFELAGKRLGADVMNMSMQASSIKKGETLIDTAMTLNAMHPDLLVVRHPHSGAVDLLAQKVNCSVLNAGDGTPKGTIIMTIKKNAKVSTNPPPERRANLISRRINDHIKIYLRGKDQILYLFLV